MKDNYSNNNHYKNINDDNNDTNDNNDDFILSYTPGSKFFILLSFTLAEGLFSIFY